MHSLAPLPGNRQDASSQAGAQKSSWRDTIHARPYAAAMVAIVAVIVIAAGAMWWRHVIQYEYTDDAFVDARTVAVSSQISGAIIDLPVVDNQIVNVDTVLVRIDPRDYETAVAQAKAQVAQAEAAIANLDAQIDAQNARIEQAQEQVRQTQPTFEFAQEENRRAQELFKTGAGTQQRAQQAASNLHQAEAAFAAANANAKAAELQLAVLKTQRMEAAGRLDHGRAGPRQGRDKLFP